MDTVVGALLGVAFFYALLPVWGYGASSRWPFVGALWILFGLMALEELASIAVRSGESSKVTVDVLTLVKAVGGLGAMFMFLRGVLGLKRA